MSSSSSSSFNPTYLKVENEGAALRVWYQGNGPLLILVQGGGGTGESFNKSMPSLSQSYTVATYDRRGNGQSIVEKPRTLNPMESTRDIIAIIKALGHAKAWLFGTSSGGILALQAAQSYPDFVMGILIHEVPIVSILPEEHIRRVDTAYQVIQVYLEHGTVNALQVFRASISGQPIQSGSPDQSVPQDKNPVPHRLDYFFAYEFLVFNTYTPNLSAIKNSGIPVMTLEGVESKDIFHAVSARVQSEILGCLHNVWRGAHAPFVENPELFAEDLHTSTVKLQKGLRA